MIRVVGLIVVILGLMMMLSWPIIGLIDYFGENGKAVDWLQELVKWTKSNARFNIDLKDGQRIYLGVSLLGMLLVIIGTLFWKRPFRRSFYTGIGFLLLIASVTSFLLKIAGVFSIDSEVEVLLNSAMISGAISGIVLGLFAYFVRVRFFCAKCGTYIGTKKTNCPKCNSYSFRKE